MDEPESVRAVPSPHADVSIGAPGITDAAAVAAAAAATGVAAAAPAPPPAAAAVLAVTDITPERGTSTFEFDEPAEGREGGEADDAACAVVEVAPAAAVVLDMPEGTRHTPWTSKYI